MKVEGGELGVEKEVGRREEGEVCYVFHNL